MEVHGRMLKKKKNQFCLANNKTHKLTNYEKEETKAIRQTNTYDNTNLANRIASKVLVEWPYICVILDAAAITSSLVLYSFSLNSTWGWTAYWMTLTWHDESTESRQWRRQDRKWCPLLYPHFDFPLWADEACRHLRALGPDVKRRYQLLQEVGHRFPRINAVGAVQNDHDVHGSSARWKSHNRRRLKSSEVTSLNIFCTYLYLCSSFNEANDKNISKLVVSKYRRTQVLLWTAGEKAAWGWKRGFSLAHIPG